MITAKMTAIPKSTMTENKIVLYTVYIFKSSVILKTTLKPGKIKKP
jgi:hypothetical protein